QPDGQLTHRFGIYGQPSACARQGFGRLPPHSEKSAVADFYCACWVTTSDGCGPLTGPGQTTVGRCDKAKILGRSRPPRALQATQRHSNCAKISDCTAHVCFLTMADMQSCIAGNFFFRLLTLGPISLPPIQS